MSVVYALAGWARKNMMDRTKWTAGRHSIEFEAPDLFHVHIKAAVSVSEAKETYELMCMVNSEIRGEVILIVHLGGTGGFPKETREYYAAMKPAWKALVIVGGSTVIRAAVSMIVGAMRLLAKGKFPPTMTVKDLNEAFRFMADVRRSEGAEQPPRA